jgi:hypothetical protein
MSAISLTVSGEVRMTLISMGWVNQRAAVVSAPWRYATCCGGMVYLPTVKVDKSKRQVWISNCPASLGSEAW